MATNEEKKFIPPSVGTVLKIAITADIGSNKHLSDNDVDFTCTFSVDCALKKKQQVVTKFDMLYMDDDTYIAIVDTSLIGTGNYYCTLKVLIPDTDVEGGIRPEVVRFQTGIRVVN